MRCWACGPCRPWAWWGGGSCEPRPNRRSGSAPSGSPVAAPVAWVRTSQQLRLLFCACWVVLIAASAVWISARGCFCYEPVRAACACLLLMRSQRAGHLHHRLRGRLPVAWPVRANEKAVVSSILRAVSACWISAEGQFLFQSNRTSRMVQHLAASLVKNLAYNLAKSLVNNLKTMIWECHKLGE